MHNAEQLSTNCVKTWDDNLSIEIDSSVVSCDRYDFSFLVFVENGTLKFCVQNDVGAVQLYRKNSACADAPSPIADCGHVWECSLEIYATVQHIDPKTATRNQQLYPGVLIVLLSKIWHVSKFFQTVAPYPIEVTESKTRCGQRILSRNSNPSRYSDWPAGWFGYLATCVT